MTILYLRRSFTKEALKILALIFIKHNSREVGCKGKTLKVKEGT